MQTRRYPNTVSSKLACAHRLRFAVSLCSLAGIICIAVHIPMLFIFQDHSESIQNQCIYDMFVFSLSMLLPTLVLGYMGNGVKSYFEPKGKKLPFKLSFLLVLFGFGSCIFFNGVIGMLDNFIPQPETPTIYINPDFGSFILMLLSSALFPAICEEVFFRGYIFSTLSHFGAGYASVISAFIFGLMHFSLTQIIFAFLCGCLFGYIRHISNRFILTVIIHFLNNAFSTVSTFIRLNFGTEIFRIYNLTAHIIIMIVLFFSSVALLFFGIKLFRFRKRKTPLSSGEKLIYTAATPALLIFIATAIAEKFT